MTLHAIVLAAGSGKRFGGGKLLAEWQGALLLHGALNAACRAPVDSILVMSGGNGDEVAGASLQWAQRNGEARLRVVPVADHAEGIAASLRTGIAALPRTAEGVFIFLGDMPRVPAYLPVEMAQILRAGALAVAPLCQGQRGHPVLISRSLFPRVRALRGDVGAKHVLEALGPGLVLIPTDEHGALFDVDRPSDLFRGEPSPWSA